MCCGFFDLILVLCLFLDFVFLSGVASFFSNCWFLLASSKYFFSNASLLWKAFTK